MMFEIIQKPGEYMLADQKKDPTYTTEQYEVALAELVDSWKKGDTTYLSLLMDVEFEKQLFSYGFRLISNIVEHERVLTDVIEATNQNWFTLEASEFSDEEFAEFYEACRSGSANKNNLFSIEQIMESLHTELGSGWRSLAMLFLEDEEVIGLAIPHIEAGTLSEGRLFYFGMMPKWRNKGKATACHREALRFLQQLQATTYVGSTDTANTGMIRVMMNNGAFERDRKGIYRLDCRR